MTDSSRCAYERMERSDAKKTAPDEVSAVEALAERLRRHLEESFDLIDAVHVHGAGSMAVQEIVAGLLCKELGFEEERRISAEVGLTTRARPDFYYDLKEGRGILAEVERGGTTTNNHDLKDFWKAHLSPDTQHLFLIVPNANWREDGTARERPFPRVVQRLGVFFGDPRREVDVLTAHVFGYGRRA